MSFSPITLFRRPQPEPAAAEDLEPEDLELEKEERWLDDPTHVYSSVRERALEWSVAQPQQPGLYLLRFPGAPRLTWRVVEIWDEDGVLMVGWTDRKTRPLSMVGRREWCPIRVPREVSA